MDYLKFSSPSRIINVSSKAHYFGVIKRDDLIGEKSYRPVTAYAQTKLANVLFARELTKRLKGAGVTALITSRCCKYRNIPKCYWNIEYIKNQFYMYVKRQNLQHKLQ